VTGGRPPGPRGAEAVGTLARMPSGRPLEACAGLFARYGDTVYLPVRPWPGLYILSRPEQAEHVLPPARIITSSRSPTGRCG
jgi:hypothetical protein